MLWYILLIYIIKQEELDMKVAKVFKNGRSQAVRIPKEFRFDTETVYIKKEGEVVMLIPAKKVWKPLIEALDRFTDDFMPERKQLKIQERENL
jgi:antitoxin VapB